MVIRRLLDLNGLLGKKSSAFLFGARGVGKTSLARAYFKKSDAPVLEYDFLKSEVYNRYLKDPSLFRTELEFHVKTHRNPTWIWIDEVQRIPILLNEVHALMESKYKSRLRFLLMGSSARKLKREGANLLAGRALSLRLHPLTHLEYSQPLEQCLKFGSLPGMVFEQENPALALKSYVLTYLREEIQQEALVRKIDAFSRFLDVAGQYHCEIIDATKIAEAAGVSSQTIADYLQILEDTFLGWRLPGWSASVRKQLRTTPKLYLFDNGVANALRGELGVELRESSARYGKLFEAWVIQELFRLNDYRQWDFKFSYWLTSTGIEVDIVVSRGASQPLAAIEIKSSKSPTEKDIKGLLRFREEYPKAKLVVLSRTSKPYSLKGVDILPWEQMDFLGKL